MTSVLPTRALRRSARRAGAAYLVAADESSLAELELLLATLPLCATGRVFVEVPDASWIVPFDAPARMTVTWLDRSVRAGEPGTARRCAHGRALTRAVTGWADEMLCEPGEGVRIHLLGGYLGTADILEHLTDSLCVPLDAISTPARFGLTSSR
ncbi:SIP domain-containing protein [Microbacterium rhizosphaerae]|uniref:SIP domain-containing protein n=1 Tax=Microbacterium rhizosphaerae TaxID=1678237 RepID=A0ABZ0SNI5_9MICO|nr:SIP domain-containing protein [Microbacterium rhizosphaerae]WPR90912.1 SIP domain-containing protein [Microbacterium rhizosphaerae]